MKTFSHLQIFSNENLFFLHFTSENTNIYATSIA